MANKMRGFLKKKKKGTDVQESQAVNNSAAKKKKKQQQHYSLMVEDVFETNRLQGVMVIGNLYGKIKQGDAMFLYQPDKPAKLVHVLNIELGPRDEVFSAKNQQVGLCLDLESKDEVSKFAVLSDMAPLAGNLASKIVLNPRLLGLTMEYRRLYTSSAYMEELLAELCRTRFLLPLYMEQPPIPQEDGTFAYNPEAQVGFRSLKKWDDETQTVFPAFTDEIAAMSWKDAFQKGQPRRYGVMLLPKLIDYVEKGHAGMVLNAFGPVPVFFPKELLAKVKESEIYKIRFVYPAQKQN